MSYLRIGELSGQTGTSNETLRFYETKGLLESPKRSPAGYRLYPASAIEKVKFIVRAKKMGFSLNEIAELLSLQVDRMDSTCGDVKQLAEQKLTSIDAKIRELQHMQAALMQITEACCGGEASAVHCTILNALQSSEIASQSMHVASKPTSANQVLA